MTRQSYGPLSNFGPEDNDLGTVFITHNVDDTVTIKVRSPGDRVFSEVEMTLENWLKLRNVGGPDTGNHDALVSALSEALAVIQDCVGYQHSGDPWEENAFDMGELDIHDYARDGRLEKARTILSHLSQERGADEAGA